MSAGEHLVAFDRLLDRHLAVLDRRGSDEWGYPDGRTVAGRNPIDLTPKERVMVRALVVWAMDNVIAMARREPHMESASRDCLEVLEEYRAKLGCRR